MKLIACTPGDGLKGNHSLQYLCIQNCSIGHTGFGTIAEALVHNKTLIELNINGNRIGNNGISLLCMLTETPYKLCMLFLSPDTKLKDGCSLKKLLLHRCIIDPDDECIQNIRTLSEMENLSLYMDYPIQKSLQVKPVSILYSCN